MSPFIKTDKMQKKYENWLRVVTLINYAGKQLCFKILHTNEHLPLDGRELYSKLEVYKDDMHFQIHEEILCPPNRVIDENKFDILIYAIVITCMFGAKYEELMDKVVDLRNEIFHMEDKSICTMEFEQLWREAYNLFNDVFNQNGFGNIESLNILKTCDLSSIEEFKGILDFLSFS